MMVLFDASVIEVDLQNNQIRQVLSTTAFRQASKEKMRLYDKVVNLVDFNTDANQVTMVFANPAFSGIYNLSSQGTLHWQLPLAAKDLGKPLALKADMDKLVIAFDSNKIVVYDTINRKIHPWSLENLNRIPANFLSRYNRILGVTPLSADKFVLWTNYTFAVLDLQLDVPSGDLTILQDHPNTSSQMKQLESASSWFDTLKVSQRKYLLSQPGANADEQSKPSETTQSADNLKISNKLKGILALDFCPEKNSIKVVENSWKQSVAEFNGAFVSKKFNQ